MERTFDRQTVLRRTLYGADIYSHILRTIYPGEIVMHIKGRDCGMVRNPFDSGNKSLKVWIQKINPEAELSDEIAMHHDYSGAIPDGNALDFARLYYRQSGMELLKTLNRELYLHLEPPEDQKRFGGERIAVGPKFSFFKAPITNIKPYKSITIRDAYNYIVGRYARKRTDALRSIEDKKRAKIYKAAHFDYATFSGEFFSRSNQKVKSESGLLCIDFDHISGLEKLFEDLLKDEFFETVLLFRSPSGDGLKWIIEMEKGLLTHSDFFRAVEKYILDRYSIQIDSSGKEVSRACFLPHDPAAYINPNYK